MLFIKHTSEDKLWVKDSTLSLQAKGMMLILTTQFENATRIEKDDILKFFTNSDASFRSALEQLRLRDYVRCQKVRATDGRVLIWVWEVFDQPSSERLKVSASLSINGKTITL